MYINIETNEVLTFRQLRQSLPNIGLPNPPPEDLINERGYASIIETDRPEGDVVTEGEPELRDGVYYQTWDVREFTEEELEQNVPPVDPVAFTYKTDVWRRATDDEAEQLDGALQDSSVRTRRMWDDCLTLEHDSELFGTLHTTMVSAFGEVRTDELLAPSVREGVI